MAELRKSKVPESQKRVLSKRERIDKFIAALKDNEEFTAKHLAKLIDLDGGKQAFGYLRRDDVELVRKGVYRRKPRCLN